MKILESAENYLESILILRNEKGRVRSIDIVNHLGFSKPSVSIAMTDTFSSQMPVKKSPRKPTNDMCSLRICSCGAEFLKKPPGKMPARSNTTSAMRPLNVSKNGWQIFSTYKEAANWPPLFSLSI